jgi:DedD protein
MLRNSLPKGWFAQVAAPKRLSEAEAMATKLKRSGFPVLIERANVRGEEYFRVVVGPESDRVQVDRLIAQVKREGYSPFPRAVK